MKNAFALTTLVLFLSACSQDSGDTTPAASEPATPEPEVQVSIYEAALASDMRPASDRDSDAGRKPAAVLEFIGIAPGDVVLEMWASGGYYTEMLSLVVGETGKVYAHNNLPSQNFAGEAFVARHADNRLPNTETFLAENNALELDADMFDAATIVLNYHDVYWASEEWSWEAIDVPVFVAELYKGLKPGGVLGIVDHRAAPGSPAETGNTLHRIDPDIVIADLENAGFVFEAESDILASSADDYSVNVFDESVRGKTDRFVLRFRKPE